jgi:hypothetical protein
MDTDRSILMPGVTELVNAAIERGEAYESQGAGKASKHDLTYYVLEIRDETDKEHPSEWYSDPVVAAALFRIWDEGK